MCDMESVSGLTVFFVEKEVLDCDVFKDKGMGGAEILIVEVSGLVIAGEGIKKGRKLRTWSHDIGGFRR